MKKGINRQIRRQLDEHLSFLNQIIQRPKNGWIRTIRRALEMSSEDLAERMNVVGSRVRRLEADEVKNKVTLSTLERAAKAMDCRFVYMFIPNGSFEEIVERRAIELARHRVSKTSRNMALEDQRVDSKVLSDLEKDLTNEYRVDPPRDFWSRKI